MTAANCFSSKPTMVLFLAIVSLSLVQVLGQSNYASHANNINYIGNGLPEETVLDGKVSEMTLNLLQTAASLAILVWVITVT